MWLGISSRALGGVDEVIGVLRHEAIEVTLQVHAGGAVRVLVDDEAGAGCAG